ncbi:SLAP domain-containing protein [Lactobacillus helveticus]|nr:SLAP domain-containing protein [Lactobacillus helveticus]
MARLQLVHQLRRHHQRLLQTRILHQKRTLHLMRNPEDSTSIKLIHNAYVYDENGKRVKNYLGTSYIGKGVTVKGLGTKTIKGTKYYALKPNHYYVKGSDVTVK